MINEIEKNDVIAERGNGANTHAGNRYFVELVSERTEAYRSAGNNKERRKLAREVYEEFKSLNPPGRFLKRDAAAHSWYEMSDRDVFKKIRQCFRDRPSAIVSVVVDVRCVDAPPPPEYEDQMYDMRQDQAQFSVSATDHEHQQVPQVAQAADSTTNDDLDEVR